MKQLILSVSRFSLLPLGMLALVAAAQAQDFEATHKVVIQVSTNDPQTQTIALNNAVNLQRHYGLDDVEVEIVAYGPGLSLLTRQSKQADRVKSLATQDITFTACGNTMAKVARKTGKEPQLIEGVKVTTAGVARIIELQEQGYSYVRP